MLSAIWESIIDNAYKLKISQKLKSRKNVALWSEHGSTRHAIWSNKVEQNDVEYIKETY